MAAIQANWIGNQSAGEYIDTSGVVEDLQNSGAYKIWNSSIIQMLRWVVSSAQVYHGYKRNGGSVGWAVGWFFVPTPIGLPLMLSQGFGKLAPRK